VADLPFNAMAFLILFTRVGAILMLLPDFSDDGIPAQVRLLLGLGFSVGLFGFLGDRLAPAAANESALAGTIVAEMLVGLSIGMIIRILFNAAAMAGSFVSMQVGLSSALISDASMGGQAPIIAKFISVAATMVCLAMGVHHLWIGAIVRSYDIFQVGALPPLGDFARLAISATTRATGLALGMAAPLMVYGILFNVALGLAARMAPAIQVFFITQPLNILLGLALFTVTMGVALTGFGTAMAAFMQSGWIV
jgi:flagellar biosynthesis protein FliR